MTGTRFETVRPRRSRAEFMIVNGFCCSRVRANAAAARHGRANKQANVDGANGTSYMATAIGVGTSRRGRDPRHLARGVPRGGRTAGGALNDDAARFGFLLAKP